HVVVTAIVFGTAAPVMASEGEHGDTRENSVIANAKVALGEAIQAAERQSNGRALSAGIEDEGGKSYYEVRTASNGKVTEVRVDPRTGAIASIKKHKLGRMFEGESRSEARDFLKAGTSLSQAIATSEQKTGGQATEAAYENENGRTQIEVAVLDRTGVEHAVKVNATDGKVLSVNTADDEHGEHGEGGQQE
ncbi:MAG: PepSY domain-containing protein, partial [Limisphaerales bacterium]